MRCKGYAIGLTVSQHGATSAYDTVENMRSSYSRPMMEFTFKDKAMADKAQLVLATLVGEGGTFRKGAVTEVAIDTVSSDDLIERLVKSDVRVAEAKRMKRSLEEVYIDIIKRAKGHHELEPSEDCSCQRDARDHFVQRDHNLYGVLRVMVRFAEWPDSGRNDV